jgi:hypothetical protein
VLFIRLRHPSRIRKVEHSFSQARALQPKWLEGASGVTLVRLWCDSDVTLA